jgi:lipoprotein-anchoring transpeptidase ErfK/SrfK
MMIKRSLMICGAAMACAAGASFAQAQGYPPSPAPAYSAAPPSGYPTSARRDPNDPNFDSLYQDDGSDQSDSEAYLPPPGPVVSPDDPRYGRPAYPAPAYSSATPTGPVMSPDDPRYGRPMSAPPAYSSTAPSGPVMSPDDPRYGRPAGPPPVIYSDRGAPADGDTGMRPPQAVGNPDYQAQQPPGAGNNRAMTVAALPPEDQPESGPADLAPNLRRQEVDFQTKEPAGTIIVDTPHTYLYYVLGNGHAIRYGVRVGRDGFTWTGVQKITRKAEWPDWHPPTEMIERQPYLPRFMAGGPGNPLGARAMYLGSTVYRIHGTNQPSTIGKFVSSGCIGMLNEDVEDLFDRVKVGTRVVVWPGNPAAAAMASAQPVAGPNAAQAMPPQNSQASVTPGGRQQTVVPPLGPPVSVR